MEGEEYAEVRKRQVSHLIDMEEQRKCGESKNLEAKK